MQNRVISDNHSTRIIYCLLFKEIKIKKTNLDLFCELDYNLREKRNKINFWFSI
jgi:hypothetical protein